MYRIRSSDNTVHEVPKHRFTPSKGSAALDDGTYPIGVLCCSAVPHDAAKCRDLHLATVLVAHQKEGKEEDQSEEEKGGKTQITLVTEVPVSSLLDDRGRRAGVNRPMVPRHVCRFQQHCSDPKCGDFHAKVPDEAAVPDGGNVYTFRAPSNSSFFDPRTPHDDSDKEICVATPLEIESHPLSALVQNPAEAHLRAHPTEIGVLCTGCPPGFTPARCLRVHLRAEVLVFGERVRKDRLADTAGKEQHIRGHHRGWCGSERTCPLGPFCQRLHRRPAIGIRERLDLRALYNGPRYLPPADCALAHGAGGVEVQGWSGVGEWSAAPPAVAAEALRAPPETVFRVRAGNGAVVTVDLRSMTMRGPEGVVRSIEFVL